MRQDFCNAKSTVLNRSVQFYTIKIYTMQIMCKRVIFSPLRNLVREVCVPAKGPQTLLSDTSLVFILWWIKLKKALKSWHGVAKSSI